MVMLSTQSKTNNSLIAKRNYTFDAVGRVAARTQTRGTDTARNDSFGYNDRSELTSATLGNDNYAYSFDNIGNRMTAEELADEIAYSANKLNQYTAIEKNSGMPFVPTFDDDGNQLTVQTATGVWAITYNAENRPITFTNGTTIIECTYDSLGRRFEKKVTEDGSITKWQRFVYRGYLQIAAFDVTSVIIDEEEHQGHALATTTFWDPMEPTATRPLAITDHSGNTSTTYFHTHDLTKNVCELLDSTGTIITSYDYTPFGAVSTSNSATPNTFTFSSEVLDQETGLVYYNYRYYSPELGRWLKPDPIEEQGGYNLYAMVENNVVNWIDNYGLAGNVTHGTKKCHKDDNCPLLVVKINLWIKNYAERQRELIIDKYNYKKINPTIYNNHILEAIKSKNHVINCTNILLKKIQNCECGAETRVPKFYPKPLPYPAPVSVSPLPWWAKGGKSVDNAIVVATDVAVVTAGLAGAGIVTVAGAPIVAASGVAVIRGAVTVGGL